MKERFIKISNNKIYFTNDNFIELSQTNFPENSLKFKYHFDIYLKVKISNFSLQLKSLDIEIIDYNPKDIHGFNNQELKKKIVKIYFKELEWNKLEKLLSSYQNNLPILIPNAFKKSSTKTEPIELNDIKELNTIKSNEIKSTIIPTKEKTQTHEFEFSEYFENVIFHSGYVSLKRKFKDINTTIEIKIFNENILPEYDYIKSYFTNYFKNGELNISTKIEIENNEILNIISCSKEVEEINSQIIDSIKKQRILNTIDFIDEIENEKNTFTADEILSKIDDSNNVFEQTEEDIINIILELKNPRNKEQLIYLSSKKHSSNLKIRFTLKPFFGFIFFINCKENNHICWELLNSHATYLWSFEKTKPINLVLEQSEISINTIKKIGRNNYRKQIRMNQLENNSKFNVINHVKLNLKDNFGIWKDKLNSRLK